MSAAVRMLKHTTNWPAFGKCMKIMYQVKDWQRLGLTNLIPIQFSTFCKNKCTGLANTGHPVDQKACTPLCRGRSGIFLQRSFVKLHARVVVEQQFYHPKVKIATLHQPEWSLTGRKDSHLPLTCSLKKSKVQHFIDKWSIYLGNLL